MLDKKKIDINQLLFDPENPRLPRYLQGVRDEKRIVDYMYSSGNIVELMYSIATLGYSEAEPLLVVQEKDTENYKVVEGNRRLAALKLLLSPELLSGRRKEKMAEIIANATVIPTEVPCIVYGNRDDILDYLGYRHITGVKDWGALEKAIYLDQLYHNHNTNDKDIYKQLAQMIGSKADYVRKLHVSYQLYLEASENDFYGLKINEDDFNFSWITVALGQSQIQKYIGLDNNKPIQNLNKENYQKLFVWLFDESKKLLDESRSITKLADVIGCKSALEKLEKGGTLEEALLYTGRPERVFMDFLNRAKESLKQAKLAIEQLAEMPLDAEDVLEDVGKLTKSIRGALVENYKANSFVENETNREELFKQFMDYMGKKNG